MRLLLIGVVGCQSGAINFNFGIKVGNSGHLIMGNYQINAVVHKAGEQTLNFLKGLNATQMFAIDVDNFIAQTKAAVSENLDNERKCLSLND